MKKIAVCISGQIRYWEAIYPFFEYWNNLFDDVEFTFFISTWKEKTWVDDKFGGLEIVDVDFDKHEFITSYSKHDHNIEMRSGGLKPHTPYQIYLMKQVQTLRKNYEDENNIKFDGVIQTRNDIFISYELLVRCIKTIKVENYFLKNSIFTPGGVSLHPYSDIGVCLILQTDTFYFGISSIMDKLIDMYDYLNTDATELQTHFIQPEFFNRKNIHCYSIKTHPLVIRDTDVRKNGRPTSKSLIKIKNEKGIDWIFQTELQEVSKEYWNYK